MEDNTELQKLVNDGKLDLRLFKQECAGLKETFQSALQLKKSRHAVQEVDDNVLFMQISSSIVGKYIITLKAISRRTQLRIKDLRDATFQVCS